MLLTVPYNHFMKPHLGIIGRRAFRELAHVMQEALIEPDLVQLAVFCRAYERLREAERRLEAEGRFHHDMSGQLGLNPALCRRAAARRRMQASAQRLGIDAFEAMIHLQRVGS